MGFLRERMISFPDLSAGRLTREVRELGYAGGELLTDATLELDRLDTVLAHGPYSSRPGTLHSTRGQPCTPKDMPGCEAEPASLSP
jgi:hypothetical protein